jgi:membrane associated rhomboid family serine protease
VAIAALLGNVAMLEEKRSDLFGMATSAGLLLGYSLEIFGIFRAMGLMAVVAVHLTFLDRVVAGE